MRVGGRGSVSEQARSQGFDSQWLQTFHSPLFHLFYSSSNFNSQLNSIIISSNFHHSIHPPPSPLPPSPMTFLYRVPFPDQWSSWDPDSRVSRTVFYLNYYCMATGRFYQKLVVEKCHKLLEICGSPTTLMWTLQQLQFRLQNLMNMRAYSCSVAFQQ